MRDATGRHQHHERRADERHAPERRREGPGRPPEHVVQRFESPSGRTPTQGRPTVKVRREHLPLSYHLVWGSSLVLLTIGLVMIFSTSSVAALFEGKDGLLYLRQQAFIAALGLVFLFVLSRWDYRRWRPLVLGALGVSLFLLLVVLVPGVGRAGNGAVRWIDLGPLSLQPSELSKLVLVAVAASMLSAPRALKGETSRLLMPLGLVVVAVCGLVMLEKDLGTTLLIAGVIMGLFWVAGMRAWHWTLLSLLGGTVGVLAIAAESYRRDRFLAFLHPFADRPGDGYQLVQGLLAFGSGGVGGAGPGRSVQKFSYLPEARTDMIFAILGEEFGLIGVVVVLALFALFVAAGWRIAMRCRDPFGKYMATGCTLLIGGQAVVNAGGVLGALPLTGVPLPFISYGKTNLLVMLAAVGVILSIARFGPTEPEDDPVALPEETANVTYLDSRGRDRGTRGPRPRAR